MSSILITGIGELVTNDATRTNSDGHRDATGLLGLIDDAAVVLEGTTIAWVGPAGSAPAADTVYDAGGRAVIPG
ncbi:MAG: imidazolonepropionase, partial [Nocardioides sp.]